MIFTDPPYGVDFERGKFVGREKAAKGASLPKIANDDLKGSALGEFVADALRLGFEATVFGGACYVWAPSLREGFAILEAVSTAGFKVQSQIIWNKRPFVIGRNDYHWKHEVCWYGFKGTNHQWYGGRDQGTVWDIDKPHRMEDHPTQRPVELARRAIQNSSRPGEVVLDLFLGSGTTLIAAGIEGRRCFGLELEPRYCDVIVARWEQHTGQKAVREEALAGTAA
jgi:DNA modification methylase